jgi:hypothetical protein
MTEKADQKLKLIVTHPGPAHRDDFLACCLLLGQYSTARIERREPTSKELQDSIVAVVDIGSRHEPELMNFDHHQFPANYQACCSVTLVTHSLGWDLLLARQIFDWFETTEWIDSKGPFKAADALDFEPENLFKLQSPIEEAVLESFSQQEVLWPVTNLVHELMRLIGVRLISLYDRTRERLERLQTVSAWRRVKGDLLVFDVTDIPRDKDPLLAVELFLSCYSLGPEGDTAIILAQDTRGDGLQLLRRNDHQLVDFSLPCGKEGVVFAHNNGFVAKLAAGVDPWPLIDEAIL